MEHKGFQSDEHMKLVGASLRATPWRNVTEAEKEEAHKQQQKAAAALASLERDGVPMTEANVKNKRQVFGVKKDESHNVGAGSHVGGRRKRRRRTKKHRRKHRRHRKSRRVHKRRKSVRRKRRRKTRTRRR